MLIETYILQLCQINIESKSCVDLLHDPRSMQEGKENDLAISCTMAQGNRF